MATTMARGLARTVLSVLNGVLRFVNARIVHCPDLSPVDNAGRQYRYELVAVPRYAPWLVDADFAAVYAQVEANTLVDRFRCYELYHLVNDVRSVLGDICEVGVWRGGTGAILAAAAARWKPESKVYLCDTFRGVVKVTARDSTYKGGEHSDTSVGIVRSLVDSMGLKNVELLAGIFPDETGDRIRGGNIALAHVDVDVYQSALDVVRWVRERMLPGGILVFDDYGFRGCDGVTRLVDELRETGEWNYIYNLNGHAVLTRRYARS